MKKTNIASKQTLIDYFRAGEMPVSSLRVGTEHEHFLFDGITHQRLPYEGERSIKTVLSAFQDSNWQPIIEKGNIIGLKDPVQKSSITIEPGGQIELSGAPLETLHQTKEELYAYLKSLDTILRSLDCYRLGRGFDPISTRESVGWMPKERYKIMRDYMPKKGKLGLDMMLRTCTVQANLDYTSEADMVAKFRVSLALQPFISALFANSSIVENKHVDYASYRCQIWQDTDPDRCGWLDFVFDADMSYEKYVDYLLSVPMYFVYRDGYINVAGQSFNDFIQGKLPALKNQKPTLQDWADHTTVAFSEVRLKTYLEMRGADCGSEEMILALPALWVGLLYDAHNLEKYHDLVMSWSRSAMKSLYEQIPHLGMQAEFDGHPITLKATEIVNDAVAGLQRRACFDAQGHDESIYLNPLLK